MAIVTQEISDLAQLRAFETECECGDGISGNYDRLLDLGWIKKIPPPEADTECEFYYRLTPAGEAAGYGITSDNCDVVDKLVAESIGWRLDDDIGERS